MNGSATADRSACLRRGPTWSDGTDEDMNRGTNDFASADKGGCGTNDIARADNDEFLPKVDDI